MGMYRIGEPDPEVPSLTERLREHPIWYGLGCLLALLIPILSYLLTLWILDLNAEHRWFAIPPELILQEPLPLIGRVPPYTLLHLVMTLVIALLLFGFLSLVYAVLYRLFGGSPYLPFDAMD